MEIEKIDENRWVTTSERDKSKHYITEIGTDGEFRCSCEGFKFGKTCKHIKEIRYNLNEKTNSSEVALKDFKESSKIEYRDFVNKHGYDVVMDLLRSKKINIIVTEQKSV
jgi:hypothetical protein